MIDTIVLTLRQDMFVIIDHDKFSPSTKGLYEQNNYYRLGGRSNMVCKQNPTPSELKAGIYKPRLTITKRLNKYKQFEIMLKIEFSIPKLLYGNNFDEVVEENFEKIIGILQDKLKNMGVLVYEKLLISSPVSGIHYSKNITLTDRSTPYTYLSKISKCNINQRLDVNQTDFRNEGHSLKYRANSFEVAFYDKLKDLNQARKSEKRAEERDNGIQLNLFEETPIKTPFEVLRMEVRLNKKQKIIQILKQINANLEPTFINLFKKDISQKVLLHFLSEIEATYPMLLYYKKEPKRFLMDFIINNPKISLKKAVQALGLRILLEDIGIREFREIAKQYKKISWYRLNSEIKDYMYPQSRPFQVLRNALINFVPLKLVDFELKEYNN